MIAKQKATYVPKKRFGIIYRVQYSVRMGIVFSNSSMLCWLRCSTSVFDVHKICINVCTFSTISLVIASALRWIKSANLPPKSQSINIRSKLQSLSGHGINNEDIIHKAISASFCITICCEDNIVTMLLTESSFLINALRLERFAGDAGTASAVVLLVVVILLGISLYACFMSHAIRRNDSPVTLEQSDDWHHWISCWISVEFSSSWSASCVWPSISMRNVPSNLYTTGGWWIFNIGSIVSTSPAFMITDLFSLGMTKFRSALNSACCSFISSSTPLFLDRMAIEIDTYKKIGLFWAVKNMR